MADPRLLLEALAHWAGEQPDKTVFTFLKDDGAEHSSITYRGVDVKTAALAAYLTTKDACLGLAKGDRVLLVFEPGLHYIVSFIACLRAGLVAVPVFPPDPRKLKKDMHMFASIAGNCGAKVALTSSLYNAATKMAALKALFTASGSSGWPDLAWVTVDELPVYKSLDKAAASGGQVAAEAFVGVRSELAFLQYTSGSTSDPKGVMISHGNLSHNLATIIDELRAGTDTVVVSWLPQYHDMGLIGSYLGALYCGGCGFYLSPFAFLKSPLIWLQAISAHRATHMQAPNFGFALAVRRFAALKAKGQSPQPLPSQKAGSTLDLSSVRHMINAAEPVDAADLAAFHEVFEPFGLPKDVVFPTYVERG
jgi:acyl-CoA synthetase (AMP-forming)/AMP-acid ligase II